MLAFTFSTDCQLNNAGSMDNLIVGELFIVYLKVVFLFLGHAFSSRQFRAGL